MKDIEWLKEEIDKLKIYVNPDAPNNPNDLYGQYVSGVNEAIRQVKMLCGELSEPEVLSKEWIDENKVARINNLRKMTMDDVVPVEKLQGILVPKQEVSMIPNYVAKWISRHHEQFELYPALKRLENNMSSWENVYEWYRENTRNF